MARYSCPHSTFQHDVGKSFYKTVYYCYYLNQRLKFTSLLSSRVRVLLIEMLNIKPLLHPVIHTCKSWLQIKIG